MKNHMHDYDKKHIKI